MSTFVVSDLARHRREVVDAARANPVRIRDADGTMLVLTTEDQVLDHELLLSYFETYVRAVVACRAESPNGSVLGSVSFIADWPHEKREAFLEDFLEALTEANRMQTARPVTTFLHYFSPKPGRVTPLTDEGTLVRLAAALADR